MKAVLRNRQCNKHSRCRSCDRRLPSIVSSTEQFEVEPTSDKLRPKFEAWIWKSTQLQRYKSVRSLEISSQSLREGLNITCIFRCRRDLCVHLSLILPRQNRMFLKGGLILHNGLSSFIHSVCVSFDTFLRRLSRGMTPLPPMFLCLCSRRITKMDTQLLSKTYGTMSDLPWLAGC